MNVVWIDRDREWFKKVFPVLEDFWKDVLFYRKNGIDKHPFWVGGNENDKKNIININTRPIVKCMIDGDE